MDNKLEFNPDTDLDRATIRLLRYVRWHKDCTERELCEKFHEDADVFGLICLCRAGFLVARRPDGSYTTFSGENLESADDFCYWASPRAKKVLDDRFDRL